MALVGKSLDAATSPGPGAAISFDEPMANFSAQAVSAPGTTYEVAFEATIDGVNWRPWSNTAAPYITADTIEAFPTTTPVNVTAVRATLNSVSGGNVTVWIAAR